MTATVFIMFTVSLPFRLSVLCVLVPVFTQIVLCLKCYLKCSSTLILSSGRLTNNDLLSLDPFSPTLAAGSSSSVSSTTGNP